MHLTSRNTFNGRPGRHRDRKKKDKSLPSFTMIEETTMMEEILQLVSSVRLLSQSVFSQRLQINTWNYRKIESLETDRWCEMM